MTNERLRQILEQTVASAYTDEQLLPMIDSNPIVTIQKREMVTVLPTSEWTNLVFAIHELTAASNQESRSD